MSTPLNRYWGRIGLVFAAYSTAFGLLFYQSGSSQGFVLMTLIVPLAVTALLFGPLSGVGFGLLTGTLVSLIVLFDSGWILSFDPPILNVLLYMIIGAGFGLFHSQRKKRTAGQTQEDAWEHAFDIQFKLDSGGTIIAGNLRAQNVLGRPKNFLDFVHPEEKAKAQEQLEYAFARDEACWTLRVVDLNQQVIPVEAQLIRDGNDLALEFHDLSEMYKIERRLSETEARYRVLIEDAIASLDTGIVILDRNRQVIWANEALARIFGVDQQWLVGQDLDRVLEKASPRFLTPDAIERIAQISTASNMTIAIQNGQGPRIFDYNSIPISTKRYQGGRIDYYHDITKNKKLEEDLRQKSERLTAINERLEAFTHVVSHDLKEPLRSLEMFSSYILEDYEDKLDEDGKDYLNSIGRAAKRMKGLIDDLLELASIGRRTEPKEIVDFDELIQNVLHDLEASLENVEVSLPSEPFPEVITNRTRIEQLFSNLISNAVKYNDKAQKRVEISWGTQGKDFVYCVKDNGIGIEPDYLDSRIFELFERLNPRQDNYQGTGAGLAICKRIVEEYGGKLWAESKFGAGSEFYFTLPQPNTKVVNHHEAVKNLVG